MTRSTPGEVRQREAFAEVFRSEFVCIHRYLSRRLGAEVADETTAETFAIAYTAWDSYDVDRPVTPWLYGIATNVVRHHRRAEKRRLRAYARIELDALSRPSEEEIVERLDSQAQQQRLAAGLASLRSAERDVLLLHAWADLSDGEVAAALAVPIGTVKSRLHRGRERLRTFIASSHQDETRASTRTQEQR